jgi:lysophospholipase L1-like esterase
MQTRGFFLALLLALSLKASFGAEAEHNFSKWEKEIAPYTESDRTNPPPKGALLFIGSSTVRLWKSLAQDFPNHQVINRGFGGSEIVDSTHFAERVIFPYQPRTVLLRAGGNDLWAGKTPEQVFADFKEFVARVQEKLPETVIVFISLSPSIARWSQADKEKSLNQMIEGFVRGKPRLGYVETYSLPLGPDGKPRAELFLQDKLHFNPQGYKLLAEQVRAFLDRK